jgi:small neutral amino acid transporter SnatA (MarC family)
MRCSENDKREKTVAMAAVVVVIICSVFTVASNQNLPFLEIDVTTIYRSPTG